MSADPATIEIPAAIEMTEELQRALQLIAGRTPLVFVSGRAGTGKSTFIEVLRQQSDQSLAVLAPTGVAAMNAGGQTIHSFFKLPPGPVDDEAIKSVKDPAVYKHLELLVIDEVSMVRADLLDGIDRFLRLNGPNHALPFGGVQVVLVGDLYQLPPIVATREERRFFRLHYSTPFFFAAHVLSTHALAPIELRQVFRQRDPGFITLLNNLREGVELTATIAAINESAYGRKLPAEGIVTLCTTRKNAEEMNTKELGRLPGQFGCFEGIIEGELDLKEDRLPAPRLLVLKPSAQVMFTKNDPEYRWVNGTTGIVRFWSGGSIFVEIPTLDGPDLLEVRRTTWETRRYVYDSLQQKLVTEIVGRYSQFPLTLAWAVTIHKSQGLTFDALEVNLGREAFAEGQVYVALSRARTLDGISLTRPIMAGDVKVSAAVQEFYQRLHAQSAQHATPNGNSCGA